MRLRPGNLLCSGHGLMLVGLKSPAGPGGRNRKSMATAARRRVVRRKPVAKAQDPPLQFGGIVQFKLYGCGVRRLL